MAKQIGIVTLYRGYNYGTSLQAYALKRFISALGYETHIIWSAQGATRGRDIRLNKIIRMIWRCLWHPTLLKHTFLSYTNSLSKIIAPQIKSKFLSFTEKFLTVNGLTKKQLISFATSSDTTALICGSDQIWSANSANVEPLYFLRFAPEEKRIAYAPSFGASSVPNYNRAVLARYISEIPFVSVREDVGAQIVQELTGRPVPVLLDPTLLLDWEDIKSYQTIHPYVLAYFLDTPSTSALKTLTEMRKKHAYNILAFPYRHKEYQQQSGVQFIAPGPLDFVGLIKGAECVLTDSFHGTAFSINLGTPFWTFERNYASAKGQGTRITSLLAKTGLQDCYIPNSDLNGHQLPTDKTALQEAKKWIINERSKSKEFLLSALAAIGNTDD